MKNLKALLSQPDKLYHIIAGLVIAAFFAIVLGINVPIIPVIIAAFIKECIDKWRGGKLDRWDFVATLIGGTTIQIFTLV